MGTGEGWGDTVPGAVPAELGGNEGSTAGSGGPRGVSPGCAPRSGQLLVSPGFSCWDTVARGTCRWVARRRHRHLPRGKQESGHPLGGGHIHGMEPIGPLCPL